MIDTTMYYFYYLNISKLLTIFDMNSLVSYFARRNQLLTFYILNLFMDLEIYYLYLILQSLMHIGTSSSQAETEEHLLFIYIVFVPSSLLAFLFTMFLLRPLYHIDRAHVVHISNTYAFIFSCLSPRSIPSPLLPHCVFSIRSPVYC
jgi:hypothetical protein